MASSSTPNTIRLPKAIKNFLFNDPEAIKAYINYVNFGKIHTGKFAIFKDFPSYEIENLFQQCSILSVVDNKQNDFVCYPNLVKMFYANLNRGFYDGQDGQIWSSVKGTQIVLDCEILGNILGCKYTGMNLSEFQINENDRETFHHIFEGDDNFEFKNRYFRPKARIINLLIQHTLIPRSGNYNNPTLKVCKALFAIFGNYDINWAQVILDELRPKNFTMGENTLYHGVYLTRIFNYFGVDFKREEFITRKVFNHGNISLMQIPLVFQPYETLTEKEERLAHEEMKEMEEEEEEEEEEEMEIKEEEEEDQETSLESIEYPTNPANPSNKTILNNQRIIVENQKNLKRSMSKKMDTISTKINKFFGKVSRKLGLSSSSSN